jgi:L-ascorbate metabolism protein UlaG (beta-lactamase superfamily)
MEVAALRNSWILMVLFVLLPCAAIAHDSQVRYLGNEGVMLVDGDTKVLMDAFYANSYGQYVLVSEATHKAMLMGTPPFDGVDALVVSHVHGDHFSPEPALEYLLAQPDVEVFAPGQVIDALIKTATLEQRERLKHLNGFDLKPGQPGQSIKRGPLTIEAVAIPHSGGRARADIDNLAFRVVLNGSTSVIHLGDATIEDSEFARQQAFWDARKTHTVFPPFWFYLEDAGREILEQRIRADQVIGIHIPARAMGKGDAWRDQLRGDAFTDPGEMRSLRPAVED